MYKIILICVALTVSCKTVQSNYSGLSDSDAQDRLEEWSYGLDHDLLKELGERIGCDEASKWVIAPTKPISQIMSELKKTKTPPIYLMRKNIFSSDYGKKTCNEVVEQGKSKDKFTGIDSIYKLVKDKGFGLTIITVGGFGSHLGSGSLKENRNLWAERFKDEGDDFRISRFECLPNSYNVDEVCGPKLIEQFNELESEISGKEHKYLLIGYSKGGTTSLFALSKSKEFRDKNLATFTMSSPIGGGIAAVSAKPLIDSVFSEDTNTSAGAYNAQIAGFLATMGPLESEDLTTTLKNAKSILGPENALIMKNGFTSLDPEIKRKFLINTFSKWDYTKSKPDSITDSTQTKVFHASGLIEVNDVTVVPKFKYNKTTGQIEMDPSDVDAGGLTVLATIPQSRNYPLNDTCVALLHAVVPESVRPEGMDTSYLGSLHTYHTNLGVMPSSDKSNNIKKMPGNMIIDSYLSLISKGLKK